MVEMAEIVRRYDKAYRARFGNRLLPSHDRALKDILRCRTQKAGGQIYECPQHHKIAYKYHSCMNRSCPKCQNNQAQNWLNKEQKKKFFLPVKALSKIFRAKLRDALKDEDEALFEQIPKQVWYKNWVVHCKQAGNGQAVLKYFAPYIFRVALSNKRIVKLDNDQVTFVYKHPKTKQWTPLKLAAFEFLRRFLQHVLPQGFKKVRHYGFLNSKYKQALTALQYKLGMVEIDTKQEIDKKPKTPLCPICGKEMIKIGYFEPDYFKEPIQQKPP